MSYLTPQELKEYNVIDSIKECEDEVKLSQIIEYCSAIINSYVGFTFDKEEGKTISVDGEGKNKIRLTERIYNVTEVKSNYEIYHNIKIVDNNKAIYSPDLKFEEGDYNIHITGDFGWESVPNDIISCLVILCNGNFDLLNDGENLSHMSGPFKSEKIGNYSYDLRTKTNHITGESIETTGVSSIDLILDQYKLREFSIEVI